MKKEFFVEYLKESIKKIQALKHKPGSDLMYERAKDIVTDIIEMLQNDLNISYEQSVDHPEFKNLRLNETILIKYNSSQSAKLKSSCIDEFRRNMKEDLTTMIAKRQH